MTQLAISHFYARRKPGAITHISSIAAQRPFFPTPVYVATKAAISGFVRSLAALEFPPEDSGLPSVRVNAVAPGVVRTPLWMEHAEKLKMIDGERDEWVEAEEVAGVMLGLVERGENVGGTVVEVGRGKTRRVEVLDGSGPEGAGVTVSNVGVGEREVWERLSGVGGK
jgi:3-hydroxybutyrate dehydrogenase